MKQVGGPGSSIILLIRKNSVLLKNATSLVGTIAVTSGLGFIYWWTAARLFSPYEVGLGSAAVAAMSLLGTLSSLGAGWMLIGELSRRARQGGTLISATLYLVFAVGAVTGAVFAFIAPTISHNFVALRAGVLSIALFALGVGLMAVTLVLDQALVGLMRGELQLYRNALFAVSKLAVLLLAGFVLATTVGLTVYVAWVSGFVISLTAMAIFALWRYPNARHYMTHPNWRLLRQLGPLTAQHYMLNNMLQAPVYLLPLLVSILLSVRDNAWFYISFMLANFVLIVPVALTTVLYAASSADRVLLAQKVRVTLSLALGAAVFADIVLLAATPQVLSLFGPLYAEMATFTLRILSLAAFPQVIKCHFIALCRIHGKMGYGIVILAAGVVIEMCCAATGARLGGLTGLSLGWLIALCGEAVFMFPTVLQAAFPRIALAREGPVMANPSHVVGE
jgi:O-antigen/teichoic acid export membrane protein